MLVLLADDSNQLLGNLFSLILRYSISSQDTIHSLRDCHLALALSHARHLHRDPTLPRPPSLPILTLPPIHLAPTHPLYSQLTHLNSIQPHPNPLYFLLHPGWPVDTLPRLPPSVTNEVWVPTAWMPDRNTRLQTPSAGSQWSHG